MSPLNLFSRRPEWLYKALGLTYPEAPHQLDSPIVRPNLDVFQQGWGLMTWGAKSLDVIQNTAAGSVELVEGDPDLVRVIPSLSVFHASGAAAVNVRWNYRDPIVGTGANLDDKDVPVDDFYYLHEFFGGTLLVVPPGIQLRATHGATGAGEELRFRWVVGEAPAGFKVL